MATYNTSKDEILDENYNCFQRDRENEISISKSTAEWIKSTKSTISPVQTQVIPIQSQMSFGDGVSQNMEVDEITDPTKIDLDNEDRNCGESYS